MGPFRTATRRARAAAAAAGGRLAAGTRRAGDMWMPVCLHVVLACAAGLVYLPYVAVVDGPGHARALVSRGGREYNAPLPPALRRYAGAALVLAALLAPLVDPSYPQHYAAGFAHQVLGWVVLAAVTAWAFCERSRETELRAPIGNGGTTSSSDDADGIDDLLVLKSIHTHSEQATAEALGPEVIVADGGASHSSGSSEAASPTAGPVASTVRIRSKGSSSPWTWALVSLAALWAALSLPVAANAFAVAKVASQILGHTLIAFPLMAAAVLTLATRMPQLGVQAAEGHAMLVGGVLLAVCEFVFGSGGLARHEQFWLGEMAYDERHYVTVTNQQHIAMGVGWAVAGAAALTLSRLRVSTDAHVVAAVFSYGFVILHHHQHGLFGVSHAAHAAHLGLACAAVAFRLAGRIIEYTALLFMSGAVMWAAQQGFTAWAERAGGLTGSYREDGIDHRGVEASAFVVWSASMGLALYCWYAYLVWLAGGGALPYAAARARRRSHALPR